MDISFKSGNEKFNYRVCAMIIRPLWLNQDFFTEDVDQQHTA